MTALFMVIGLLGYGAGFEGFADNGICFGIYTPEAEYGWVITDKDIYLNTVFIKRKK